MSSSMSRCKWCGKDFDKHHAVEAFRPEGESYGSVCSEQCLALAGCVSKEKKDRLDKEAAIRRSSEEARQLLQQEKYEEAIAAADKLAALDGKCVEANVIKGIALARKGRYELAIPELEEALKLDSGHAEAKTSLEALFSDGNQLVDYAKVKYEEKAFDTVVLLASKMIERSPSCFDAYLLRGKSHRQTKKYKEAVQDFAQALDRSPEDAKKEILRERGACHLDLKEFPAAIDDCSAALQIDGQDGTALLTRGKSYLAMKEYALAAIDFYESARIDQGTKGEAVNGIDGCEKHLTATMMAEVSEKPTAKVTSEQRQGLDKIIEIYKLKEKVAEIERGKKRATSPLLAVLLVLGLASLVSCFGLFAAPIRYEWYGPFLFLNLTWVAFAMWEGARFKKQQWLDQTVNAPLVDEIERQFLKVKEHETSFGLDRAPKKEENATAGIVVVGVLLLAISAGWLWGYMKPTEKIRGEVAVADQQWDSGEKAEAVSKYKQLIFGNLWWTDRDVRPRLFQRVVETELASGDTESAKLFIKKALDNKLALSFSDPKASALLAQVQSPPRSENSGGKTPEPDKDKPVVQPKKQPVAEAKEAIIENVDSFPEKYSNQTLVFKDVKLGGEMNKIDGLFFLRITSPRGKYIVPQFLGNTGIAFVVSPALAEKLLEQNLRSDFVYGVNVICTIKEHRAGFTGKTWAAEVSQIDFLSNTGATMHSITEKGKSLPTADQANKQKAADPTETKKKEVAQKADDLSGRFDHSFCTTAALSHDGKYLVTASLQSTILWDVATGKELRRLKLEVKGKPDQVSAVTPGAAAVTFSKNGQQTFLFTYRKELIDGALTQYSTVAAFETETGKQLRHLDVGAGEGTFGSRFVFSSDPRFAVYRHGITDVADSVRCWDIENAKQLCQFDSLKVPGTAISDPLAHIAVSHDASRILVIGNFGRVHDGRDGKELATLTWEGGREEAVAISPDGKRGLIAAKIAGIRKLSLWDLQTGKEMQVLVNKASEIRSLAISPNGQNALVGLADKTIQLWDLGSQKELRSFRAEAAPFRLSFAPDGRRFLSLGDGKVLLWELNIK